MLLGKLFSAAGLECPQEYSDINISRIVTDSREACEACMFICIEGHNTDGHGYIKEAINKGAVVIVCERVRDECVGGAAIIKIDNTRRAAALLYNAQCGEPSKKIKLVGVTGTNGKTSVCHMLESIFSEAGVSCGVIGTVGVRIDGESVPLCREGLTTPDAAQLYPLLSEMAERGVRYVFMEVSSHSLVLCRVDGLEFECGIFTNLTRDHLDFHGSMEEYFRQKSKLFSRCRHIIVNGDDEYGKRLLNTYGEAVTCSVDGDGDFCANDVKYTARATEYKLVFSGGEYAITLGALGDFSLINSLEAAAAALTLGISPDAVIRGLLRFNGAKGRMERVLEGDCPFGVIVDYAHTPDALERLLLSARRNKTESGRIVVLFGCGGDRDRGKRKQMGRIASRLSDLVIVTSDNSRSERAEDIISDILKGIDKEKPYKVIVSRKQAIEYAIENARDGDIILLAGKGHEKYEIDADGKHFFDEVQIVKDAAARINKDKK